MSIFGDYKSYKKYEPLYSSWKFERDSSNAKRLEYLNQHPELRNNEDLQRAQSLLRAIDVMDEYSQKRAEDMEVATENIVGIGLDIAMFGGVGLGYFLCNFKPFEKIFAKLVKPIENILKTETLKGGKSLAVQIAGMVIGGIIGTLAAFPMMAWAAKTEVSASRKGRFEAMKKELDNPNGFAVLTNEQINQAKTISKSIKLKEKNKIVSGITDSWKTARDLVTDSGEYRKQRLEFLSELEDRKLHINEEMSPEETEAAKRDQQLLTKIVDKIDIASQDYAENAELATQTAIISVGAFGGLISLGLNKLLNAIKIKSAGKISAIINIATVAATIGTSIFAAQIQKQASRVGRFKAKQELMKNPDELIYVDDAKASTLENVSVKEEKKQNIFKFLQEAWRDNKEYNNYLKNQAQAEKKFYKAIEKLELTPEQIKQATALQKNTFRTFNKIDENSQKYAESVEALGQASMLPVTLIFTGLATLFAPIIAFGKKVPDTKIGMTNAMAKIVGITLLSTIPTVLMNAYITKEQKKASRIANMMAINEMSNYKEFRA